MQLIRNPKNNSSPLLPICMAFAMLPTALFASEFSERGVTLFMENKPQEAAPVLEMATKEAGADEKLFLYLGIAYQQLGKWDEAIASFRRGVGSSALYRHQFLFNIANSFYAQGKISFALEYYDQALAIKTDYTEAYLNRANAKMRLGDHPGAVNDYSLYLSLDPGSPQASEIRRLLDLLGSKAVEADRQKAEEELRRIAEEQAKQAMLDEVARTLMEAAEATTNLSAGSGDVQGYDSDLSLDD
ncbi:MAG: tetratricopeptide repeat protein [Spirochaetia bacterium]|jgi:tetratricopeptide (TPR) repeat protein|nr:tetratricopeptide repeat protein [Spirochaetia bacterium]